MRRPLLVQLALTVLACGAAHGLAAQQDDDRWLRQCRKDGDQDQSRFCEIRHLGFKPSSASLTFDPDQNGGLEITAWDRDSVEISARVEAQDHSDADARALAGEVKVTAGGSAIRVDGPSHRRHSNWSVELVVMVPRKIGIQAATTNGPLSVEGVSGTIDVRATNGPVALTDLSGDVHARVQNGPLTVRLKGAGWNGAGLDAESTNGPVDLAIPEHYNAELETGTVNGPTDFRMPITVTLSGRRTDRIHTTLGKGGAPVRVVTTNGPLTVRRAID
jgi:DUF4097 and DUF4098 domain-containing protein YvlB